MECIDTTPYRSPTGRRTNKPMVERRRRERINKSLEDLKQLVLNSLNKDSTEYSKMEKADILEMTVSHIRASMNPYNVQQKCHTSLPEVSSAIYQAGFRECAAEVVRYLATHGSQDVGVKSRLSHHLSQCASSRTELAYRYPHNDTSPQRMGSYPLSQPVIPEATRLSSLPGRTYQLAAVHPVMSGSDTRDSVKHETSPRSGFLTPPASPIRENSPPEIIKPLPSCHASPLQIAIPHQYSTTPQSKLLGFSRVHPVKRLQHRPVLEHQAFVGHRRMWRPW